MVWYVLLAILLTIRVIHNKDNFIVHKAQTNCAKKKTPTISFNNALTYLQIKHKIRREKEKKKQQQARRIIVKKDVKKNEMTPKTGFIISQNDFIKYTLHDYFIWQ